MDALGKLKRAEDLKREIIAFVLIPAHHYGPRKDLIEALEKGYIWGAGLDVTNPEPMKPGNPLLSMENVAVLPHIGSATIETRNAMSRLAAGNIIEFYKGNRIPNIVNPEV